MSEFVETTLDCAEGEFNSIMASLLGFLPSFNHPIRPREKFRRNRQADLLGGLEINH